MRIIGGKYKRHIIKTPANLPVRPTTDLAKESLFNVINNNFDFEAITVLDLFAGTGSISFEFASRGAIQIFTVETEPKCIRFIKQQAEKLLFDSLTVVRDDAHHFLSFCTKKFDVIFADPPYEHKNIENIHELVFEKDLLENDGWLVIEHGANVVLDDLYGFFEKRRYGRVHFSMFAKP